jgi:hypothetical protein
MAGQNESTPRACWQALPGPVSLSPGHVTRAWRAALGRRPGSDLHQLLAFQHTMHHTAMHHSTGIAGRSWPQAHAHAQLWPGALAICMAKAAGATGSPAPKAPPTPQPQAAQVPARCACCTARGAARGPPPHAAPALRPRAAPRQPARTPRTLRHPRGALPNPNWTEARTQRPSDQGTPRAWRAARRRPGLAAA